MKTIFKLLSVLTLLGIIIVSCKKKDEPNPEPQPTPTTTLVTTWTWKEFDENENGNFSAAPSGNESLTFKSDGSYASQFSYYKIGEITAVNDDSGTYVHNGDSLIMSSSSGKTMRTKILKLSSTELWFI